MPSLETLITDPSFKRLISPTLQKEAGLDYPLALTVKQLLPNEGFSATQYLRGLDYFKSRLQAVFPGQGTLLDVGCGAGNWTVAASSFFDEVIAV